MAAPESAETPPQQERRRQLRGLLWVALAVMIFTLVRVLLHPELRRILFTHGWWRIW